MNPLDLATWNVRMGAVEVAKVTAPAWMNPRKIVREAMLDGDPDDPHVTIEWAS